MHKLFFVLIFIVSLSETVHAQEKLNGTFMVASHIPNNRIAEFFDELQTLKMDTIILSRFWTKAVPKDGSDGCYNDVWIADNGHSYDVATSKLTLILNEAQKRRMKVYVGMTLSGYACSRWHESPNREQAANKAAELAAFLAKSYKSNTAFAGFYLTDEPWLSAHNVPDSLYEYYRQQAQAIRKSSQLPIITAPYLGGEAGVGISPPSVLADRALKLKQAGITIQAWQDAAGADGGFDIAEITSYFEAISQKIGKTSLWSDVELFNAFIPMEPDNFGGTRNKPTFGVRLEKQLKAAPSTYVDKRVTWINSYFMSALYFGSPNSKKIERVRATNAHRLFDTYNAMIGNYGTIIRPNSYEWITRPSSSYPDSNELFNKKIGAPKKYYDPEWTGVQGNAEVHLKFSSHRPISWVSAHVLNQNEVGVRIPKTMTIRCYNSASGWRNIQTTTLYDDKNQVWLDRKDGEFVFANDTKLSHSCKELKVYFQNDSWTFVSEIEIVSGANPPPIVENPAPPLIPGPTKPAPVSQPLLAPKPAPISLPLLVPAKSSEKLR